MLGGEFMVDRNVKAIKDLLFLVYSAGFEAGYGGKTDLVSCFNRWYSALSFGQDA